MFKVKNKAKDVRKFRDKFLGKDILVEPNKFVFTNKPPQENEVWEISHIEKSEEKKIDEKEVNKNDSSSSR